LAEPFLFGLYGAADVEFTGNDTIVVSSFLNPGIFRGIRQFGVWTFSYRDSSEVCNGLSFGGPSTLYCGSLGLGVLKSTDNGLSWNIVDNELYAQTCLSSGSGSEIPDSTFYMMNFGGNIYRTNDWGTTWTRLPHNPISFGLGIEVAPTDPNFLIASAIDIEVSAMTRRFLTIYSSTDGGSNWNPVDSTYLVSDFLITGDPNIIVGISDTNLIRSTAGGSNFITVFTDANGFYNLAGIDTVFVATYDSTYVSYDRGANWTGLIDRVGELVYDHTRKLLYIAGNYIYNYDLNTSTLDSILYRPYCHSVSPNGNLYFLGYTDTVRIARSFDGGNTVEDEIFPVDTYLNTGLRAADDGVFFYQGLRGFWVSNDITSGVRQSNDLSFKNEMIFAPTIIKKGHKQKINLTIDREKHISLSLYDITGRLVKKIFDGQIMSGTHTLAFPTTNLSSGVYFIIFSSKGIDATIKQIVY
jgi:hypothetical protein